MVQITRDGEILTNESHRLLSAKLEQKEFAKAHLRQRPPFVDPVLWEQAESQRRFVMKKLEEHERAENVRRIRVTICD